MVTSFRIGCLILCDLYSCAFSCAAVSKAFGHIGQAKRGKLMGQNLTVARDRSAELKGPNSFRRSVLDRLAIQLRHSGDQLMSSEYRFSDSKVFEAASGPPSSIKDVWMPVCWDLVLPPTLVSRRPPQLLRCGKQVLPRLFARIAFDGV